MPLLNKRAAQSGALSPLFFAPLADSGSGAVNLALTNGTGSATFTRATAATTILSTGLIGSVLSGVARSAYSPAGVYLGYLAEGQRTNLCLQSETFDNATWNKQNATVTANATTAPDGTVTADMFTDDATNGAHRAYQLSLSTVAGPLTASCFFKSGTANWVQLLAFDGLGEFYANFNVSTGALGNKHASVTSAITPAANGFYRCTLTVTTLATASANLQVIMLSADTASSVPAYVGSGSTMYAWGIQWEQAAFASSYISTTTAAVTKNIDVDSYSVSGNVGTNDQTLVTEWAPIAASMGTVFLWGSYVDASNYTAILHDGTNIIARKRIAGVNTDATKALTYVKDTVYKIAARFSSTAGIDIFVDGVKGTNHVNTTALQLGSAFQLGADGNGANSAYARFRNHKCFGSALTDSQVAAL